MFISHYQDLLHNFTLQDYFNSLILDEIVYEQALIEIIIEYKSFRKLS